MALELAPVAVDELGESLVVARSDKGHQVGCHAAALPSPLALLLASPGVSSTDARRPSKLGGPKRPSSLPVGVHIDKSESPLRRSSTAGH